MSTPVLSVEDVTKTYGSGHTAVTAVHGASLTLGDGEFLALVGPSGSGKTTLLSMIGGLLSATSGRIRLGDVEVTGLSDKERTAFRAARVGFVFQTFNLVPFLTARENLTVMGTFVGRRVPRARARRRADALLDELGLSDRGDNLPEQLSGGER